MKIQIKNHTNLLKSIFKMKNLMIFYIDDAKDFKTTKVAMM